jgi:hypothetical protein
MAISALLFSAFLVPAVAGAQPTDGGAPVPDGGVMSGMDAGAMPASNTPSNGARKGTKVKSKADDRSNGNSSPSNGSGAGKAADGTVDAGPARTS